MLPSMVREILLLFSTKYTCASNSDTLTLFYLLLSNLIDARINDTDSNGDGIDNGTVSSLSTFNTESTTARSPTSIPGAAQPSLSAQQNTPNRDNRSETLTVEGAPLVVLDSGTVSSVPQGSNQRNIDNINDDREEDGYDSDGNIGPFIDAVAHGYEIHDEALMDVTDSNAGISLPPAHNFITPPRSTNEESNMDEANITQQGENAPVAHTDGVEQGATQDNTDTPLTRNEIESMTVALLKVELRKRGLSLAGNKPILKQRLLEAVASNVRVR